jgi:ribonuclease III
MDRDIDTNLKELQASINYHFNDISLLREALTHKSFAHEQPGTRSIGNERLEFLGDAVLELSITHMLMERFPDYSEGTLTKLRAGIVNKEGLAAVARALNLGRYVLLGRGEEGSRGRVKNSILANTYEALIAAVYYDGGYERVFKLVENHFSQLIHEAEEKGVSRDYKTRLQEYSQSALGSVPEYVIVREEGPDHEKIFEVYVTINSVRYETGRGKNKKAAEQEAARRTLSKLTDEHHS